MKFISEKKLKNLEKQPNFTCNYQSYEKNSVLMRLIAKKSFYQKNNAYYKSF